MVRLGAKFVWRAPFCCCCWDGFCLGENQRGKGSPQFFLFSLNSPLSQIVGGNDKSDGDLAGGTECKWSIVMLGV